MNAIEVSRISKQYKNFSLSEVSFQVPKGSIVGLVGENGAGKSTTIKGILGLLKLESGTITVLGADSNKKPVELNEDIGVVFDSCCFPENLTVKRVKHIFACTYKQWQPEAFDTYVSQFKLPEDKIIKEFSRGMKMKLSIAVALSHQAKLLILDEATSGLDPIVRDKILDIFLDFMQDEEHSILVSSHIISDLEKVADYIVCIHKGQVLFARSKDELRYEYGVAKCREEELKKIDKQHILGSRKGKFGYEVLVDNRNQLAAKEPDMVVDPASIEEIILFQTKGE